MLLASCSLLQFALSVLLLCLCKVCCELTRCTGRRQSQMLLVARGAHCCEGQKPSLSVLMF
jgi:hypothetical protein